jgi:hypothetical protein
LALAPLVVLAHIAEEVPGFLGWASRHVEPEVTVTDFVTLNVIGLLVTVALAVPSVRSRNTVLALALVAWLSFVMLANGILHLTASFLFREYVPGTVTAGLLYLPYFAVAVVIACRKCDVRPGAAILAATIGAVPMVAQGVSILTVGRRLLW